MKHDVLGEIQRPADGPFDAVAIIRYDGRDVRFQMDRDDQPLETTLELAAEVARNLAELDATAKRVAVADLREIHNNGWNAYDEVEEDGSLKSVANPQLSEAEFEARLSLTAVNVTGDLMIHFFYDDQGMFWGHAVVVYSGEGVDLAESHAELFG